MGFDRMMKVGFVQVLGPAKQRALTAFLDDESGQDQLEYGLVAALLSLGAVAALKGLATNVAAIWQGIATGFLKAV